MANARRLVRHSRRACPLLHSVPGTTTKQALAWGNGGHASTRAAPRLSASVKRRKASRKRRAPLKPPVMKKATIEPKPLIWRNASACCLCRHGMKTGKSSGQGCHRLTWQHAMRACAHQRCQRSHPYRPHGRVPATGGWEGRPGYTTDRTASCASSRRATAMAVREQRSIRTASVLMPRSTK